MIKRAFAISFMINLALLVFIWNLLEKKPVNPENSPDLSADTKSVTAAAATVSEAPVQEEAKSFRWSQIESTDYNTYVANLRAIGCPEATIRDIITADVNSLYERKREQLQDRARGLNPSTTEMPLPALQALQREQAGLISTLLGPQSTSFTAASETSSAVSQRGLVAGPARRPSLPLAFQNVDSGTVKLNDNQKTALDQLQQNFLSDIGGQNADVNDPEYAKRWQKAQPNSDTQFRGFFGQRAFLDYNLAAGKAAANQTAPAQ
jgi:hypothetical protein